MENLYSFQSLRYGIAFLIAGVAGVGIVSAVMQSNFTSADWIDPILEQMEIAYEDSLLAERTSLETYKKAEETYFNTSISRCELEKSLAYYKLAMGYEMNREAELREKTEMNCVSF